jgi:hypothetical protein
MIDKETLSDLVSELAQGLSDAFIDYINNQRIFIPAETQTDFKDRMIVAWEIKTDRGARAYAIPVYGKWED